MPRAKRPLCNRQFVVALSPHVRATGWICCINNSIALQRKPEEGLEYDRHRVSRQGAAAVFTLASQRLWRSQCRQNSALINDLINS